jgi:hypothetical protein
VIAGSDRYSLTWGELLTLNFELRLRNKNNFNIAKKLSTTKAICISALLASSIKRRWLVYTGMRSV